LLQIGSYTKLKFLYQYENTLLNKLSVLMKVCSWNITFLETKNSSGVNVNNNIPFCTKLKTKKNTLLSSRIKFVSVAINSRSKTNASKKPLNLANQEHVDIITQDLLFPKIGKGNLLIK